jgi:hypothetical protein
MTTTVTLQKNMLSYPMQWTHSVLPHPAELVWLRLGLHCAFRLFDPVLQIDRFPTDAYTKKKRQ